MNNGVTGKMILDSVSPEGIRLSTIHVRYPRMIHGEVMTHRALSRNGRSSRAVPVKTLLAEDHYTPHFKKNRPGMVAGEEFTEEELKRINDLWENLACYTKYMVGELSRLGVHKQWANRPLEAFGFIDVLLTSTDWANFFALRDDEAAQPEIESVAKQIRQLLDESEPKLLHSGDWHLPYIELENDVPAIESYAEHNVLGKPSEYEVQEILRKVSVARCARLTIRPFDGDGSIIKEVARYEKLMVSRPVHASPAEHIATPDYMSHNTGMGSDWVHPEEHGNFYGWRQFRKMIPDNTILDR